MGLEFQNNLGRLLKTYVPGTYARRIESKSQNKFRTLFYTAIDHNHSLNLITERLT